MKDKPLDTGSADPSLRTDASAEAAAGGSLRERLSSGTVPLTLSETKIVQVLLADYPRAGLGSASALARRAGVSDPTVVRLVNKLGYASFSAFQASLLEDVEARLRSPLMMMERSVTGTSAAGDYMRSVAERLIEASEAAVMDPYRRATELILGARGRVTVVGGRFSRHVAAMLSAYLLQIRPGIDLLSPVTAESADLLLDIGRRDVLIAFDYRRYQTDVISLVRQAAERGARIVLFTDPFLSPLADLAEVIFIAPLEVQSPFDSLAPAVAQMEALVAHLVTHQPAVERRIDDLEKLRRSNAVTMDEDRPAPPPPDPSAA